MRVMLTLATLAFLLVIPAHGDQEPCFVGTPATIVAVERTADRALLLHWTAALSAEWYEVMRCDASGGPCTLMSLATTETPSFADTESESSSHFWYRIVAHTGPPGDLCAYNEYCSLPDGQCAGEGATIVSYRGDGIVAGQQSPSSTPQEQIVVGPS